MATIPKKISSIYQSLCQSFQVANIDDWILSNEKFEFGFGALFESTSFQIFVFIIQTQIFPSSENLKKPAKKKLKVTLSQTHV